MHEAAHAVVAVLLGMKARATLEKGRPGCGACDVEGPSTDDAKAMVRLLGGLG